MNNLFHGIEKMNVEQLGRRRNVATSSNSVKPPAFDVKRFFIASALAILASVSTPTQGSLLSETRVSGMTVESLTIPVGASVDRFPLVSSTSNFSVAVDLGSRAVKNHILPQPSGEILHISTGAALRARPAASSGNVDLQENTIAVLDADEQERLAVFKRLERGWDFGSGERLQAESLRTFDRFFAPGGFRPEGLSLFMSSSGNLVANYQNNDGSTVELEFLAAAISYFNDSQEEASIVPSRIAAEFRRQIARDLNTTDARRFG